MAEFIAEPYKVTTGQHPNVASLHCGDVLVGTFEGDGVEDAQLHPAAGVTREELRSHLARFAELRNRRAVPPITE
jgi:hypothetical protein